MAFALALMLSACIPRRSFEMRVELREGEAATVFATSEDIATRMNCRFREGEPRWQEWPKGKGAVCHAMALTETDLVFFLESSGRRARVSVEWREPRGDVPADVQNYARDVQSVVEGYFDRSRIDIKTTFWP